LEDALRSEIREREMLSRKVDLMARLLERHRNSDTTLEHLRLQVSLTKQNHESRLSMLAGQFARAVQAFSAEIETLSRLYNDLVSSTPPHSCHQIQEPTPPPIKPVEILESSSRVHVNASTQHEQSPTIDVISIAQTLQQEINQLKVMSEEETVREQEVEIERGKQLQDLIARDKDREELLIAVSTDVHDMKSSLTQLHELVIAVAADGIDIRNELTEIRNKLTADEPS